MMQLGILKFRESFMPRLWGGDKLRRVLGKNNHVAGTIGEAWLISDHAACESVVAEGNHAGKTLRELMLQDSPGILGINAKPTPQGRFPLLLKLIDAGSALSVQVHPDDGKAAVLGETDTGKTEMWQVLEADRDSVMISGLCDGVTKETFEAALASDDVAALMQSFPVAAGDSVFVAAGTVHAIGAGILLAEIQQNSDITYRIFDWNRLDKNGTPRDLHIEKALAIMDFSSARSGRVAPLRYTERGVTREALAACPYFAAERVLLKGHTDFASGGRSFHIILALDEVVTAIADGTGCVLKRGEAALIPASTMEWHIEGEGSVMDYYVADIPSDIIEPLRRHGYNKEQIRILVDCCAL